MIRNAKFFSQIENKPKDIRVILPKNLIYSYEEVNIPHR